MCIAERLAHIVAPYPKLPTNFAIFIKMCSFGKTGLSTIRWIRFFMNCQPQSIDSIVYVYTCTDVHTRISLYIYTRVYVYIYVYNIYTYVYIYVYMHISKTL